MTSIDYPTTAWTVTVIMVQYQFKSRVTVSVNPAIWKNAFGRISGNEPSLLYFNSTADLCTHKNHWKG